MKGLIFTVEGIGNHGTHGPLLGNGTLKEFNSNLWLGAEGGVSLALRKPVCRRIGLDLKRVRDALVSPEAGDGDHTSVGFAEIGQVLTPNMCGPFAILAVTTLVNDEDTGRVRGGAGIGTEELQALGIDDLRRPGRRGEKPLHALGAGMLGADDGLGVGQRSEGLVAFGRQEQALQLAAHGVTLIAPGKEWIKVLDVGFESVRSGCDRQSTTQSYPPTVVLSHAQP
jgi:hypothetical protein